MGDKNYNKNNFEEEVNIRELIGGYLTYWVWFVLSVMISFSVTFVILRFKPKSYESKAKLLIRYEKAGNNSKLAAFQDLGLFEGFGDYNNLYNEKEILQSRPLIEKVVRCLNLNIEYQVLGKTTGIERQELYNISPVKLNVLEKDALNKVGASITFKIDILDERKFKLSVNDNAEDDKIYAFTDTIVNPKLGKIQIQKSETFNSFKKKIKIGILIKPIESAITGIQSQLSVEPISENVDILLLSIKGPVIEKNNDFLDSLIAAHTQQTIDDQLLVYRNTTRFINDRIQSIADELTDVETDGEKYKTEYDFSDIYLNERSLYDKTFLNEKKLLDAEIQLKLVESLLHYITEDSENDLLLPANLGLTNDAINKTVAEYNKLALEKMRLIKYSSEKNPAVIKVNSDLISLKENLKLSIKNTINTLKIEVANLEMNEVAISSNISAIPKHQRILRSIERQQQVKESLYLYLLQKREENEIASSVTEGNSKLIENAYSSGEVISPKKKMYYAGALFVGLMIPFFFIFIKNLLNNKVQGQEDLKDFDLPHLVSIPWSKEKITSINMKQNSAISEAIRLLRTNISFMLGPTGDEGKVILLTSTVSKEGKTFISLNLGASYAFAGKKTIVVGLDLRAPKILEYLKISYKEGITDMLVNPSISLDQIIIQDPSIPELSYIPSGSIPPNPAELLMLSGLTDLIKTLRSNYDIIILDTAPVGYVTDTLLISHLADACAFVVKAKYLEKRQLSLVETLYKEHKLPNLGVIINSAKDEIGLGYGYGYGYGYVDIEKKSFWKRIFSRK